MTLIRGRRTAILGTCVIMMTTGCIGAIDRADFEGALHARGGGLVTALPAAAVGALEQRLGATGIRASVVMLTAPNSSGFQLVVPDQPAQVTRFLDGGANLAGPYAVARFRIQVPQNPDQLDDYTFALDDLSEPAPVQVMTGDVQDKTFAIADVSGLARIEEIVDTALAHSELDNAYVPAILVNKFGRDILMTVNVTSPRGVSVAQFDRTGTFIRVRRV
ncbi:hypothetical protein [Nocardia sp. CA-290969]|uniref:hypothetical protein n=1 Tax=Nocardia sp. CA-290969 TaxID=3239986 RepID=UPI003D914228